MSKITRVPGQAKGRCRYVTSAGLVWSVATSEGAGDNVAQQTHATLANLEANLLEAGSDKHHILEAVVYLGDMDRKAEMDEVWCAWIPDDGWPNRACVGADLAAGDLDEIKVTAKILE